MRIAKIFFRVFLVFLLLLGTLTAVLYIYKDEIASRVLSTVHNVQKGEVIFEDIQFTPFEHFPNMSIRLDNLRYYEHFGSDRPEDEVPIAELSHLYLSLDVVKLLQNEIEVERVTLENGSLNLVVYPDSSSNIGNAIAPKVANPDTTTVVAAVESEATDLSLKNVYLREVEIRYSDGVFQDQYDLKINEASSRFKYTAEQIELALNLDVYVHQFLVGKRPVTQDLPVSLSVETSYERSAELLEVANGNVQVRDVSFDISGRIDGIADSVDLNFAASDEDFSILRQVLNEDVLDVNPDLLKEGTIYARGSVKGHFEKRMPVITAEFGAENLSIAIPDSEESFQDLFLKGTFNSGTARDFSQATLAISDLSGRLPGGDLQGRLRIEDFTRPVVSAYLSLSTNLEIWDDVFRIDAFDVTNGSIAITSEIDGILDFDADTLIRNKAGFSLEMNALAAEIPGLKHAIENLSGRITYFNDSLQIDSLFVESGPTDLHLAGSFTNLNYILLGREKEVAGDLEVKCGALNIREIPEVRLNYGPFNQTIRDVWIDLSLTTTVSEILDTHYFLSGDYTIRHVQADIDSFTKINDLQSIVRIRDDSTSLRFDMETIDLKSDIGDAMLSDVLLLGRDSAQLHVSCAVETDDFKILRLLESFDGPLAPPQDSLESLAASLKFKADFVHTPLRASPFETHGDIRFVSAAKDTIEIHQLEAAFPRMTFYVPEGERGRIIEEVDGTISVTELSTPAISESNFQGSIQGRQRFWQMNLSGEENFFKGAEKAQITIDNRDSIPTYHLDYEIAGFKLEDLLSKYYDEDIMRGELQFKFDIGTSGTETSDLLNNAHGSVLIAGSDIVMYGLDLDELLKNYRKSQNFNLADLGAVALMGPFGVVVTKGYSFAQLSSINPDDSTVLNEIHSLWELDSGKATAQDVAITTTQNLVAVTGTLDYAKSNIDLITVGIVDKNGCSLLDQSVSGPFEEPELGPVHAVGKLFGAFVNVYKLVAGKECDPFYSGVVKHPSAD